MTEQLKPCPFCGGTPKTIDRPDNIDGTQFFYAISCYCGRHSACAHKMAVRPTPEEAKQVATEAWNTRAALAQPADVEPVAWMYFDSDGDAIFGHPHGYRPEDAVPVYTHPPARVPLTKTRVGNYLRRHVHGEVGMYRNGFKDGVAFAEAAHGIGGGK